MAGEGQFFVNRKNSYPHPALAFDSLVAGQDKSGFRKVHFARDGLHLLVAQPASIGEYSQRVALEWLRGKNVELREREVAKIFCHIFFLFSVIASAMNIASSKKRFAISRS